MRSFCYILACFIRLSSSSSLLVLATYFVCEFNKSLLLVYTQFIFLCARHKNMVQFCLSFHFYHYKDTNSLFFSCSSTETHELFVTHFKASIIFENFSQVLGFVCLIFFHVNIFVFFSPLWYSKEGM